MKFTAALVALATVASASATTTIKGAKAISKVLSTARKLDQNNNQQQGEYDYLTAYSLKLVSCRAGETVVDPETGEYDYNAVIVRLCPVENGCDSSSNKGCSGEYGEFVVGLNTYVDAFFEDQRDNMQWDDNFEVDRYAECNEYEIENDGDNQYQQQYFIGPTCSSDGVDIRLGVFDDEVCTYESETTFETISNGWALPYSDGGLVSTQCLECMEYDDDGNYQLREMCENVYTKSSASCETNMQYYSQYGQNVQGCEYLEALQPVAEKSKNGAKVFGWILFVAIVVGLVGYTMWWRKKKASGNDGLMS